jgi:hypothetical protein
VETQCNTLSYKLNDAEIKQAYVTKLEKQLKTKEEELTQQKEREINEVKQKKKSPKEVSSPEIYIDDKDTVTINGKKFPFHIFETCKKEIDIFSKNNNGNLPKHLLSQIDCYKAIMQYMETMGQTKNSEIHDFNDKTKQSLIEISPKKDKTQSKEKTTINTSKNPQNMKQTNNIFDFKSELEKKDIDMFSLKKKIGNSRRTSSKTTRRY